MLLLLRIAMIIDEEVNNHQCLEGNHFKKVHCPRHFESTWIVHKTSTRESAGELDNDLVLGKSVA